VLFPFQMAHHINIREYLNKAINSIQFNSNVELSSQKNTNFIVNILIEKTCTIVLCLGELKDM